MAQIAGWRGYKNENDLHDDITIVVIDFKPRGEFGDSHGQGCG